MYPWELAAPFIDWLNDQPDADDLLTWEELGIKENAPEEATRAYETYLESQKQAQKSGVKI